MTYKESYEKFDNFEELEKKFISDISSAVRNRTNGALAQKAFLEIVRKKFPRKMEELLKMSKKMKENGEI